MTNQTYLPSIFCHNNRKNNLILRSMGYKVYGQGLTAYVNLDMVNLTGSATSRLLGYLLTEADLEVLLVIPTADARIIYVLDIVSKASEILNESLKDAHDAFIPNTNARKLKGP